MPPFGIEFHCIKQQYCCMYCRFSWPSASCLCAGFLVAVGLHSLTSCFEFSINFTISLCSRYEITGISSEDLQLHWRSFLGQVWGIPEQTLMQSWFYQFHPSYPRQGSQVLFSSKATPLCYSFCFSKYTTMQLLVVISKSYLGYFQSNLDRIIVLFPSKSHNRHLVSWICYLSRLKLLSLSSYWHQRQPT